MGLVNPPLHRMDVRQGGEVQAAAPYERANCLQKSMSKRQIPGNGACLDHGGTFPIQAHAFVVGQRGMEGDRRWCRGRIGPQPQIGPEDIPIGVPRFHQGDQVARHPRGERADVAGSSPGREPGGRAVVNQNQVDIRRIIQLRRAQLAHGERDEPTVQIRPVDVLEPDFPGFVGGKKQMADREPQRCLSQFGKCAGHGFQRPDVADVRDRGDQCADTLGLPQCGSNILSLRRGGNLTKPEQAVRERGLRAIGHQPADRSRLPQSQFAEIRTVAAEAQKQ